MNWKKTALCAFGFTVCAGLAAQDTEIIPNGDFEEGMHEWQCPLWPRNSVNSFIGEEVSRGRGRRSLLLKVPAGKNATVLTPGRFALPKDATRYVLTFYAKKAGEAADTGKNGTLEVRTYLAAKGLKELNFSVRIPYEKIGTEWTEGKLEFSIPTPYETGSLWIYYSGTQTDVQLYVDDIVLKPVTEE